MPTIDKIEFIEVPKPHGFLIWRGKQTSILSDSSDVSLQPSLLTSDGEAYGVISLEFPVKLLNDKEVVLAKQWSDGHLITEQEYLMQFKESGKTLYCYRVKKFEKFENVKQFRNGEILTSKVSSDKVKELRGELTTLPKQIDLIEEAVLVEGKSPKAIYPSFESLLEPYLKTLELEEGIETATYSLSLVRHPNFYPQKKEYENSIAAMLILPFPIDFGFRIPFVKMSVPQHITLFYFGEVTEELEERKEAILEIFRSLTKKFAPIEGFVNGYGIFESDFERPLYANFDSKILGQIRAKLVDWLRHIGIETTSEHGYTPHITIGYVPEFYEGDIPNVKIPNYNIQFPELVLSWGLETYKFPFSGEIGLKEMEEKAVWSTAYINDLPDSAFLWVESGGEKDEDGKTTPRSLRHLPYKDSSGNVDMPHLENAIARAPQIKDKNGNSISESKASQLQNKARNIMSRMGKEASLESKLESIRGSFYEQFDVDDWGPDSYYVSDVLESAIIVSDSGRLYRVPFMLSDNENGPAYKFPSRNEWVEVEVSYNQNEKKGYKEVGKQSKLSKMFLTLKTLGSTIEEVLGWAEEQRKTDPTFDFLLSKDAKPVIMVKEVNGEPWHTTYSSCSFIDREGEIISQKALEDFLERVEDSEDKGYFNFWHINEDTDGINSDFAVKKFQALTGRFLIEAGPYLDNEKGKAAKEFFLEYTDGHPILAPEGWGASVEFQYLPLDRLDGIYDFVHIGRTSTLPRGKAANIWTSANQQELEMPYLKDEEKRRAAEALFGAEWVASQIKAGEEASALLEERTQFKEKVSGEEKEADPEEENKEETSVEEETPGEEGKESTPESDEDPLEGFKKEILEAVALQIKEGVGSSLIQLSERLDTVQKLIETESELKSLLVNPRGNKSSLLEMLSASKAKETEVSEEEAKNLGAGAPEESSKDMPKDIAGAFFTN